MEFFSRWITIVFIVGVIIGIINIFLKIKNFNVFNITFNKQKIRHLFILFLVFSLLNALALSNYFIILLGANNFGYIVQAINVFFVGIIFTILLFKINNFIEVNDKK